MEFEYTSSIHVAENDIDEMANLVKKGLDIYEAFDEVMMGYDDADYYNCNCIYEQVKKEIEKRLDK